MMRSELVRLRRSSLIALHVTLAAAIGLAAGWYFAVTPWDALLAYDAFVQLLGAGAALLAGISCGLSIDAERDAGDYANLLGHPARRRAFAAKATVLLGLGALACLDALLLFVGVLAAAGKPTPSTATVALSFLALTTGAAALYAIALAAALARGRNASIAVGALGFMIALASLGGLGNGLVTGTLSASIAPLFLIAFPFTWPARLAALSIEVPLAAKGAVSTPTALEALVANAQISIAVCVVGSILIAIMWLAWVNRFEDHHRAQE
ncbi:MAG: ABC transporter permease [Slackia sp.]|nr:ABC transporter permease [Slackia sp.]